VRLAGRSVGAGAPVYVIAEAGVNHNGDAGLARALVEAAAVAGADAVKFQCFSAERLVSPRAPKARYQTETTGADESQLEMLRRLELADDVVADLAGLARARGLHFLATPFDDEALGLLITLGVPAIKVGSGEITNLPFLAAIGRTALPVILSTGMSTLGDVEDAVAALRGAGTEQLILLHCVSCYPAAAEELNLRAIPTLARAFHCPAGFSDHSRGLHAAVAAVALGACVIEKHFTLDRDLPGPDHRASLRPDELAAMIASIRDTERALGDGIKRPVAREAEVARAARRSVVAVAALPAGTALTPAMLAIRRPGTGIPPAAWADVLGRRTRRDVGGGEILQWEDLA